jgi:hypothetical protein
VVVSSQPVGLCPDISIHDIAFSVLETPGSHDQRISFPYPGPPLHRSLDPAHPGDPVRTPDANVVCPEHQFGLGKLFSSSFFWQPYPDNRCSIGIHRIRVKSTLIVLIIFSHSTNYAGLYHDGRHEEDMDGTPPSPSFHDETGGRQIQHHLNSSPVKRARKKER